jgi:hypothetical protein
MNELGPNSEKGTTEFCFFIQNDFSNDNSFCNVQKKEKEKTCSQTSRHEKNGGA